MEKQELCAEVTKRASSFLESGKWTDCKFVLGAEPHQVVVEGYKLVMAMASPVFEAMFYGGLAETKDHIPIEDVESDIFKVMLRYIHTGNLKLNSCDEAMKLYYTANKYMMDDLKKECSNYLQNNVNQDNVCKLYEITQLYEDEALKRKCLNVMKALIETQNSTDVPEQAKPGSSHMNDDVPASAPPPYTSCVPIVQDPIPMTSSWVTEVSLVVKGSRLDILEDYLSAIVDFYEGPIAMKEIVLGVYALAGVRLKKSMEITSGSQCKSLINKVIQFCHYRPLLKTLSVDMNWQKSFGYAEDQVHIDFKLKMTPSKRTGCAFHEIYNSTIRNFKPGYFSNILTSVPPFKEIKELFVLTNVEITENSIIF